MVPVQAAAAGVCFQCGSSVTAAQSSCHNCGMPVLPELASAAPQQAAPVQATPVSAAAFQATPVRPEPSTATLQQDVPSEAVVGQEFRAQPAAAGVGLSQPALTLGAVKPQRRIGRKPVLISVAALGVLILAAIGIAVVSRLTAVTPQSTVEDYFTALGNGDAAGALKLVYRGDEAEPVSSPLLTAAALADHDARPHDVKVGTVTGASGRYGAGVSGVDVAYSAGYAGNTRVHQTVVVTRATSGDGYQLRDPFVQLVLSGGQGRAVTINGVAVNVSASGDVAAFSGGFKAELVAATALLASASVTAGPLDGGFGTAAELRFGPPQLAPGVQDRINAAVKSVLDRCATSTEAYPSGCPFDTYVVGTNISVHWTITAYPVISVDFGFMGWSSTGDQVSISDGSNSGRAHWTATYTDYFGKRQTESGDTTIRIYGTAKAQGSDIQVNLE